MTEFVNVQEIFADTFERPDISQVKKTINATLTLDSKAERVFIKVCANDERFWAQVNRVEGGKIYCTVANDLLYVDDHGFDYKDPIVVEFDNIYDVYVGEGSHDEETEENLTMFHETCNKVGNIKE